ncbi:hypothetical protein Tco_1435406 [Tanacetum coccineum]
MTTTYWRADSKTGEMIGPLDEEELAKNMWRTICRVIGLPVDATYVINNDYQNMTWSEKTCDGLWRNVYRKRGSIKTPSDDELIERKKNFIEKLKKKLAEGDLDEFEITKIGKMMKKTKEDLDELMNKEEDAPKMKKKKIEP